MPTIRQPTPLKYAVILIFTAVILFLAVRLIWYSLESVTRPAPGFVAAYAASRLLLEGESVSRFYDDDWFAAQVSRFEPAIYDIYVNPPTAALLMLPFALMPYALARAVWTAVNIIGLVIMFFWLVRQLRFTGVWVPLLALLVLCYQPIYANIAYGQIYLFLLALSLLAWHGYRQQQDGLTGVVLGLMACFKLAGLFLWLLLLAQKRWRAIAWGIATGVGLVLLTLPWLGIAAWERHMVVVMALNSQPERLVTAYQTWLSFTGHFFVWEARWNPAPLFNQPALWGLFNWFGVALFLTVSTAVAYRTRPVTTSAPVSVSTADLLFAAFTILGVVLGPLSLDYHFPLLLLPVFILVAWLRAEGSPARWLLLSLGIVLIAADLPYRSPRLAEGIWAILAYPKLYGSLLLWGLAITGAMRSANLSRRT